MDKEEMFKRFTDNITVETEEKIINGKKAYDYYNEQPFFKAKLARAKEFLRKHPPPGFNPDDIID